MHLVVDFANQVILPQGRTESFQSWINKSCRRIRQIVNLARRWGLKPIFVCDAAYMTEEVREKWRLRREKEAERGIRKIPYNADTILCEILLDMKLDLVFDREHNADDIIATVAIMHPKSVILSRDNDYFRYDEQCLLHRVFYMESNTIVRELEWKHHSRTPLQTIRMYFPVFAQSFVDLTKFVTLGEYKRGTAYPKAERSLCQSLHLASRPFRQLLYDHPVHEIFPVWDDDMHRVLWMDDIVDPVDGEFPSDVETIYDAIVACIGGLPCDPNHEVTIRIMASELFAQHAQQSLTSLLFAMDTLRIKV